MQGRYLIIFGRATPYGADPWGKALAKINGRITVPINNMSGSHVIVIELSSPTTIQSLRLEINGTRFFPGIKGIEIHP